MIIKTSMVVFVLATALRATVAQSNFSTNPDSVAFHTEDIPIFWKVFDQTSPKFDAKIFQDEYIDAGSAGVKGFVHMRIESGKNLSKTIKDNLAYYQAIRESTLSIDGEKKTFYSYFHKLKELYPKAEFPDVYFVVGAKNSGGTTFKGGLVIGAEMYGKPTETFTPSIDIQYIDEIVLHESVHFQQKYKASNQLLAQCIKEGAADFVTELVAGSHSNIKIHEYGNAHTKELWDQFVKEMNGMNWSNWLYSGSKNKERPKDLGYWMGYKIVQAYYSKMDDKQQAIDDMLNITDYEAFLKKSGYNGE